MNARVGDARLDEPGRLPWLQASQRGGGVRAAGVGRGLEPGSGRRFR